MFSRVRLFLMMILISVFLSSCNILLSSPRPRENPEDEAVQITSIAAVPKDSSTAYVTWSWKSPVDWMNSEDWITEIKIEHSSVTYPEINIPFAGRTFSRGDNWETEWSDLSSGRTHYFSLFMKDNGGTWYPPLMVKVSLPDSTLDVTGRIYSRTESINIYDGTSPSYNPLILTINSSSVAVVYMDFDEVYITSASLSLSVTTLTSAGDIEIFPLSGFLPGDDFKKWQLISDDSLVNTAAIVKYTVSSGGSIVIDILNTARAAALTPWKAVGIRSVDGLADVTIDNNASAPFITADLVEKQ